jgi:YVTN family beta-propeller protein
MLNNTIFVVNWDDNTVSVIDARNYTKIEDIPVGEVLMILKKQYILPIVVNAVSLIDTDVNVQGG